MLLLRGRPLPFVWSSLPTDHILFARKQWRLRPEWKWGEGRQTRPNLKLQGRHNGITQVKKVCSRDQPELQSLSEWRDVTSHPAHWHLLGRLSRRKPPPGVSPPAPPVDSRIIQSLCCDLCPLFPAGRFAALHCSAPTGSLSFPSWFSGLLPARLETRASQDLPPASELPLPCPPLELG